MRVQLIVVQGKPEGKTIPLIGPVFKIGRGETCHLRPNSERVSREHAEFTVTADGVTVRDLGSRNGTLVNGKALNQPHRLKDRDLVQVGPLTFTVSIQDASAEGDQVDPPAPASAQAGVPLPGLLESWPVAEGTSPAFSADAGPRGSETIMIPAFLGPATRPGDDDEDDDEYERHPAIMEGDTVLDVPAITPQARDDASQPPSKKAPPKPAEKGKSDAATEILRKMMERLRVSK